MAAYSYNSFHLSADQDNLNVEQLISINASHPLNNPHRPPYWSATTAAQALMVHAERQLTGENGPTYFKLLKEEHKRVTMTSRRLSMKLEQKRRQAETARSAIDHELTDAELIIGMRMAEMQARIGRHIVNHMTERNLPAEMAIEEMAALNRRVIRLAIENEEDTSPNRGSRIAEREEVARQLMARSMAGASPPSAEQKELIDDYLYLARELADITPKARYRDMEVFDLADMLSDDDRRDYDRIYREIRDRKSPEYTKEILLDAATALEALSENTTSTAAGHIRHAIDEMSRITDNPVADLQAICEKLSEHSGNARSSRGHGALAEARATLDRAISRLLDPRTEQEIEDNLNYEDAIHNKTIEIIFKDKSREELEELVTTIPLTTNERAELASNIVESFPPTIQIPDVENSRQNFSVRMTTEAEAQVMQRLIEWAATTPHYPGPEASRAMIDRMRQRPITTQQPAIPTMTLFVDQHPALDAHAQDIVATFDPNVRLIVIGRTEEHAAKILEQRGAVARGSDLSFDTHTGTARIVGEERNWALSFQNAPLDKIVANSTYVAVLHQLPKITLESTRETGDVLNQAKANLQAAEDWLAKLEENYRTSANQELRERLEQVQKMDLTSIPEDQVAYFSKMPEGQAVVKRATIQAAANYDTPEEQQAYINTQLRKAALNTLIEGYSRLVEESVPANIRNATRQARAHVQAHRSEVARIEKRHHAALDVESGITGAHITAPQRAAAWMIDLAHSAGKLEASITSTPQAQGDTITTAHGPIVQQNYWAAVLTASRLLQNSGETLQALRHLNRPANGVTAILIDASNIYYDRDGLQRIQSNVSNLPSSMVILQSAQMNKQVRQTILEAAPERPVIRGYAWRIEETNTVITDRGTNTTTNRYTDIHLGFQPTRGAADQPTTRIRWNARDIGGSIISIAGAGTMTEATYRAINQLAEQQGIRDPLSPAVVERLYHDLQHRGIRLPAPQIASAQGGRAIMQEALIDHAQAVEIAANISRDYRDYHSAQLIRMAADTGKLTSVIGYGGKQTDISKAYEAAKPFAPTIADTVLQRVASDLGIAPNSPRGQTILKSMGLNNRQIENLAMQYPNLGEIAAAAINREAIRGISPHAAEKLGSISAWKTSIDHLNSLYRAAHESGLQVLLPANPEYPDNLKERHGPIIYVGRQDAPERQAPAIIANEETHGREPSGARHTTPGVSPAAGESPAPAASREPTPAGPGAPERQPTVAVVTQGDQEPTAAERAAALQLAERIKIHKQTMMLRIGDRFSNGIAHAIAHMDDKRRPNLIIIGEGHQSLHARSQKEVELLTRVHETHGTYITAGPILPTQETDREGHSYNRYKRDPVQARCLFARLADSMIVMKMENQSKEFASVREAMQNGVPIAVYLPKPGPEHQASAGRYTQAEYAGAIRLAAPSRTSYKDETRQAQFIPISEPEIPFPDNTPNRGFLRENAPEQDRTRNLQEGVNATESAWRILEWKKGHTVIRDERQLDTWLNHTQHTIERPERNGYIDLVEARNERAAAEASIYDLTPTSPLQKEIAEMFGELETPDTENLSQHETMVHYARLAQGRGR